MIYFTADTHFGHTNIIAYCKRPYETVEEMDNDLIKRWNRVVQPKDTIFHLGDFCLVNDFFKYFNKLNGRKILIKGNHDEVAWKYKERFHEYCDGYYELTVNGQLIVLCHYAMKVWNKSHVGSWHLYGHSHGTISETDSLCFDVGVDVNNFTPISFNQVKERMEKKIPDW